MTRLSLEWYFDKKGIYKRCKEGGGGGLKRKFNIINFGRKFFLGGCDFRIG